MYPQGTRKGVQDEAVALARAMPTSQPLPNAAVATGFAVQRSGNTACTCPRETSPHLRSSLNPRSLAFGSSGSTGREGYSSRPEATAYRWTTIGLWLSRWARRRFRALKKALGIGVSSLQSQHCQYLPFLFQTARVEVRRFVKED
jgi:hypothetical protein